MVLWIPPGLFRLRLRGSHPLRPAFPGRSPAPTGPFRGPNPGVPSTPVWAPPVSLAATPGITFVFFSSGYLDVSVHRVPPARLWIHRTVAGVSPAGFPHSDTHGSLPICGSPWLFAACRVFLRLLVPRHPPCALPGLTMPAAPPSVAGAGPVSSCFVSASWMSFLIIDFGSLFGFQGTKHCFKYLSGSHLLSHAVSSIVPSAAWGLTCSLASQAAVFGMGTGVSPKRIATGIIKLCYPTWRYALRIRHRKNVSSLRSDRLRALALSPDVTNCCAIRFQ